MNENKTLAESISDLVKSIAGSSANLKKKYISAVVVAAGSGTRMGGDVTKQLAVVGGIPVVVRTLMQFEACEFVNEVIVVAREDEVSLYDEFIAEYGLTKLAKVVVGGDTRQKSVLNGFNAISDKSDIVAIHDGARCLVTPQMITDVLTAAAVHGCATAASRTKDTIKRAGANGYIAETLDRSEIWHAQTPQVFRADIYRAAAYVALEKGTVATDDNALVEAIGFKVKLVDCGYENIKLTTPDDLAIAEAILTLRERRKESEVDA